MNLLPQWSPPRNVSLKVLPPPDISSSSLLSLDLTTNSQDDFLVEVSIELAWTEPEGVREDVVYEVWVGPVPLEEYEEASQELGDIVPLEVQPVTPALCMCVCGIHVGISSEQSKEHIGVLWFSTCVYLVLLLLKWWLLEGRVVIAA